MNGGEIIARVLKKYGVKHLFTLCGGHVSPIFVEAERAGIRVIDTRHEVNAVFAADAVSRLTGTPGVAVVTAGPGLTNTITAVKNAALAQSPLILFGGAAATILKGRGSLQDIDQLSIMRAVCKHSFTVSKVKELAPTVERAFYIAQEGVPGPVFVECPIDTLYGEELVRSWYGAKAKDQKPRYLQERIIQWYINYHAKNLFEGKDRVRFDAPIQKPKYPVHSAVHIQKTIGMLRKAQKPLMLVGSGALMNAVKASELATAVERLGIPVYLSGMGRGLLGKDHPLQMRHHRKEAIKESDLIILAGVPNDFRLDYGNHIGHRPFISVNRSREDLFKNKTPTLAIHADPQEFLIALSQQYQGNHRAWLETLRRRDTSRESNIDEQAALPVQTGMNPIRLFRELEPLLDDNSVLIADGGDFVATASYILRPRAPLTWLDPGVFGTLGVGAGFALGAKLVYPQKDVWIIYGDGSAGYSLMEYDTFKRFNLPVISVIGNDACWSQIARDQIDFLKSDCAMKLAFSDYQKVAQAFGGEGERVENIDDFKQAVQRAVQASRSGTPYIINAIIGKTDFRKGSISV
ncbi:MAG: thiamine pyrophosphate-binding protein [Chitinophagales bacterium]|nr:thiamine pyrophosphate-binding protein [Chitinophagales bacterium]MDW8419751.1 thiamine pyrophosphate-binding protein [Chitinophagales bacterium]